MIESAGGRSNERNLLKRERGYAVPNDPWDINYRNFMPCHINDRTIILQKLYSGNHFFSFPHIMYKTNNGRTYEKGKKSDRIAVEHGNAL